LIAALKLTALDGIDDLIYELAKGRSIGAGIESKDDGGALIRHVLVH
jgi:flagellar basal body P-ring protein FlgI